MVKNQLGNARNKRKVGSIPGLGRSPEEGIATDSSILAWRIPRERGAWQATVRGVTKSQTRLKPLSMHACLLQSIQLKPNWRLERPEQTGSYMPDAPAPPTPATPEMPAVDTSPTGNRGQGNFAPLPSENGAGAESGGSTTLEEGKL